MHVLALYQEGEWPYADILPTTKDAFEEALNQTNIIEQQCIEYGLESIQLDEVENFLLKAEKNSCIEREDNEDNHPWSITVSIDENGHLNMTGYSQINKNYNFEFTIKYKNIKKD
jgi:hypothetical protein